MNGYLLDTSVCVALFRGNTDVEKKLNSVGRKKCYVTDVVVAELKFGAYKSSRVAENLQQISDFIEEVKVVPFASTIDTFAQERLRLMKNGNRIDDFDLLIGCAAKSMGLTMVTHNVKHFEHIEGIHIEDWIK